LHELLLGLYLHFDEFSLALLGFLLLCLALG
jgi:hypothetical protein